MTGRSVILGTVLAASALLLSSCATPSGANPDVVAPIGPGSDVTVTLAPHPPRGEVIGQGTVMDVDGTVELCLGAVMESYPPQCRGIPLEGWSWEGVDGSDSSGGVRWGSYAVQGTYDGTVFTVTAPPILLALYDPAPIAEATDPPASRADEQTLIAIQDELPARFGQAYLTSWPEEGHLHVQLLWDDGTWQRAVDDEYGAGVVIIHSALRGL